MRLKGAIDKAICAFPRSFRGKKNAMAIQRSSLFIPVPVQSKKNCCSFFHFSVVFLLTSMKHNSIHSSTAIYELQNRCNPSKGRIGKMATKKAAKKAPAKKAAKKAVKKAAKKK